MTDPTNQDTQPTADTVRLIWEGMVGANRLSRYYGYLAHRLKRLGEFLQVAAVVLGVLTLSSIFYRLPGWIAFIAANFAALAFALSMIRGYSSKADRSAKMFQQLERLQTEWELLWNNVWSKNDDELLAAWSKLCERQEAIIERAPVELPLSTSLARKSQNEAHEYWRDFARNSQASDESLP